MELKKGCVLGFTFLALRPVTTVATVALFLEFAEDLVAVGKWNGSLHKKKSCECREVQLETAGHYI